MKATRIHLLLFALFAFTASGYAQENFIAKSSSKSFEPSIEKDAKEKIPAPKSLAFLMTPDFIYWHVSEDFLDLLTGAPSAPTSSALAVNSFPMDFSYHPGLKICLGISKPSQSWGFAVDYTFLLAHNKKVFSPKADYAIARSDWFSPFFAGTITPGSFFKARWSFLLNELDGAFCYFFVPNVHWSLKPYIGLKALWIDQKYHVKTLLLSSTDSSSATPFSNNKSNSWGIGPRLGADLDCSLGKGMHFLGAAAFSLLYQEFSLHHFNSALDFQNNTFSSTTIKGSPHKLCPYLEAKMGLSYDFPLHQKFQITLSGLYEFHFAANEQQLHALIAENPHSNGKSAGAGNLYMHGLTTGLQFRW